MELLFPDLGQRVPHLDESAPTPVDGFLTGVQFLLLRWSQFYKHLAIVTGRRRLADGFCFGLQFCFRHIARMLSRLFAVKPRSNLWKMLEINGLHMFAVVPIKPGWTGGMKNDTNRCHSLQLSKNSRAFV
jgi:hypothetical protein